MLTIEDIKQAYEEGITLRLKRKPAPDKRKGEFDLLNLEVRIFLPGAESKEDKELTILHEFIHARDGIKGYRYRDRKDYNVEREAANTLRYRSEVLKFIKQLYKIR